jgi:hypothetical protein
MNEYYDFYCKNCKSNTQQYISKTSRKRGVKLTCCKCWKEQKSYTKKDLQEYSPKVKEVQQNEK